MGVNYLPIGGERPAAGWEGKCHKKAGAGSTWKEGSMTVCKETVAITTLVKPTLCIDRKNLPSDEISAILFNAG